MRHPGWLFSSTLILVSVGDLARSQVPPKNIKLVVNDRSAEVPSTQINGRTYVDLEALVRVANGSLGVQGNQATVTLTTCSSDTPTNVEPGPAGQSGLSQKFMVAGIETIAQMREWASTLAYAIQNGYGVTDSWLADYREQAANSLTLATSAASNAADRQALTLLKNEFETVRQWSNKLLEAKKSMDIGKYAVSHNTLREEPLSQKIIACGHFLGTMLGSGEFKDDLSCH